MTDAEIRKKLIDILAVNQGSLLEDVADKIRAAIIEKVNRMKKTEISHYECGDRGEARAITENVEYNRAISDVIAKLKERLSLGTTPFQTQEKIKSNFFPIGTILPFINKEILSNALPCDGLMYSKERFNKLYKISKGFCPETETHFAVPNFTFSINGVVECQYQIIAEEFTN